MKNNTLIGCVFAALAVVIGAFGAHALKDNLGPYELSVFSTASKYHFYHSFALILYGHRGSSGRAGLFFSLGIIIFSGSLYLLATLGLKKLGAITPIGGLFFIIGWVLFALEAYKENREKNSVTS